MSGSEQRALVLSIHLHDSRFHGLPDWPPAPARVFQALLAGAGFGGVSSDHSEALRWLEKLPPPIIGAPRATSGQSFTTYVPNNDLDAVDHDPARVSEIRIGKEIAPQLISGRSVFLYLWPYADTVANRRHVGVVCRMCAGLYQFGRGVDMAWANGEDLSEDAVARILDTYTGKVYRPSDHGGTEIDCPTTGSLDSLAARYRAGAQRFRHANGRTRQELFVQPPPPVFDSVAYDSLAARQTFEFRAADGESFVAFPLPVASDLVVKVRNRAVERLKAASPTLADDIERSLVGRKANGADSGSIAARIRVLPIPSLGHDYVDLRIRRLLVEVPAECPIRPQDAFWAFAGADIIDESTGEVHATLVRSTSGRMTGRFVEAATTWRTVTAAALPHVARRRRIDPARVATDSKPGSERAAEEFRASEAVLGAIRHAQVDAQSARIKVQREPFDRMGARAEQFAPSTRFAKERLWHVQIEFSKPVTGPLVIGDGRFVGLGVMAPIERLRGAYTFIIENGLSDGASTSSLTRSLRRAVLSRLQHALGSDHRIPQYFSGHEADGSPGRSPHVAYAFDEASRRLLVLAPHVIDHRQPNAGESANLDLLEEALTGFVQLKAGAAGALTLRSVEVDTANDPLFAPARRWDTAIRYDVIRHRKTGSAHQAFASDLTAECVRIGLGEPHVGPHAVHGMSGVGLSGDARLTFPIRVRGPILLGRTRFLGGGLFVAV